MIFSSIFTKRIKKYHGIIHLDGGVFVLYIFNLSPKGDYSYSDILKIIKVETRNVFEDEDIIRKDKNTLRSLLSRLLEKIPKNFRSFKSIEVVFGQPWYVSFFEKKEERFLSPKKFSFKFLNRYTSNLNHENHFLKNDHNKVSVSLDIIDIRLNGYRIKNPEGKYAEVFSFVLYKAFVSARIINIIKNKIGEFFKCEFTFTTIEKKFLYPGNFFIENNLDIAFSSDNIYIFGYKHKSEKIFYLKGGLRKLYNIISAELGLTQKQAVQFLDLYSKGQTDSSLSIRIEMILEIYFANISEEIYKKISNNESRDLFLSIDKVRLVLPESLCVKYQKQGLYNGSSESSASFDFLTKKTSCLSLKEEKNLPFILWHNYFK